MRNILLTVGISYLVIVPAAFAQAPTGRVTPEFPKAGSQSATPGATGPGSENNGTTTPTDPNVPPNKKGPPDIPANGAGSGSSGTTGPTNPNPPGAGNDTN